MDIYSQYDYQSTVMFASGTCINQLELFASVCKRDNDSRSYVTTKEL